MRLAGYAALFDRADASRDTIRPGAFARTLAERTLSSLGALPFYWQHRPEQRIGWVDRVAEDARGLRVIASLDNPAGRAATMLALGAITGLSFGYRARAFRHSAAGRLLEDIELLEVSLVTHPLQHAARVHLIAPPRDGEVAVAEGG